MAEFVADQQLPTSQSHAWRSILDVDQAKSWNECLVCKSALFRVDTMPLKDGRKRKACTFCMQRYNVNEIASLSDVYADAGSW